MHVSSLEGGEGVSRDSTSRTDRTIRPDFFIVVKKLFILVCKKVWKFGSNKKQCNVVVTYMYIAAVNFMPV